MKTLKQKLAEAIEGEPWELALEAAEELVSDLKDAHAPLPQGFRRFDENDWSTYCACEPLPDGTRPILVRLEVQVDYDLSEGEEAHQEQADLIICGSEERGYPVELVLQLEDRSFGTSTKTVEEALELAVPIAAEYLPSLEFLVAENNLRQLN